MEVFSTKYINQAFSYEKIFKKCKCFCQLIDIFLSKQEFSYKIKHK